MPKGNGGSADGTMNAETVVEGGLSWDPNLRGVFPGGPPLMNARQARGIVEEPESVRRRIAVMLRGLAKKDKENGRDS